MSLYNLLLGMHPLTGKLLAAIDLAPVEIPRFRDMFISCDGTKVYVLARIGGHNRASFVAGWHTLRAHHTYESDRDDAFDNTYAWITFSVLPNMAGQVKLAAPDTEPELSMLALTTKAIDALQRGEPPADQEGLRLLMERMRKAFDEGGDGVVEV